MAEQGFHGVSRTLEDLGEIVLVQHEGPGDAVGRVPLPRPGQDLLDVIGDPVVTTPYRDLAVIDDLVDRQRRIVSMIG